MKKPKVTIIIPVYNGKKYMKEAIDSAISQTYENIEILVINDGSKDDGASDRIARSYGDKIRYIEKENGGVSTVLNLALKEMTGDYFSWLSHDDVYYQNKIEEEINFLNNNNLIGKRCILYSDYDLIDEKSRLISEAIKDHEMLEKKPEYALLRGTVNGITLLIPKKAFDECGNFDEKLRCAQDYELWYRMMKSGYEFIHISKILAKTRYHQEQVSNTNPKVETEGNKFWIDMIDDINDEVKERLEGTVYNYYKEMVKFLKDTPYKIAEKHCEKKAKEIEQAMNKNLSNYKVSVIIPFYNRSKCVINALKSVLNQTHKNIEILLVNDGSTDDITNIKEFIKNKKNIRLISLKENKGASYARNVGIDNAKGSYIAFLDSDDTFQQDKIKIQLLEMLLTGAKFSHTSYLKNGFDEKVEIHSGLQTGEVIPMLIWTCQIATPTVMLERKLLNDNNFRYDSNLTIGEDTCFWLKIACKVNLLGIDIPLTVVNVNDNSAAYNMKKQIIGLKSILTYVLNDPELSNFDIEISKLARSYFNMVFLDSKNNDLIVSHNGMGMCPECEAMLNSRSWKITKPLRLMGKVLRSIKKDGIIKTIKKIFKHLTNN